MVMVGLRVRVRVNGKVRVHSIDKLVLFRLLWRRMAIHFDSMGPRRIMPILVVVLTVNVVDGVVDDIAIETGFGRRNGRNGRD